MSFSFVKAVKNTHRHPLNKLFHLVGLTLYAFALFSLISYLANDQNQNLILSLALWLTAINLFITGHMIEDNVRAITAVIVFKYIRSKLYKNQKEIRISNNNRHHLIHSVTK